MSLVALSLVVAMPTAIMPPPCVNAENLRNMALDIVQFARENRSTDFNRLVAADVSMAVWVGDQGFGLRTDDRAARTLGDSRQQLMTHLKNWNFNRYALRNAGIACTVEGATELELISDANHQSFFLTFRFSEGRLSSLEGQGYFLTESMVAHD